MQAPSVARRSIFKPHYWRRWRNLQKVESLVTLKIITADTAFEAKTSADWSVFQVWGFIGTSAMVLMDQFRGQVDYPDLTKAAKKFWEKHTERQLGVTPVTEFWVENKASGISLVKTLRALGIPARAWEPKDKTPKDKVGRANHSTLPMSAGRVWIPDSKMPGYAWVDRFESEHTSFSNDDSHLNDDQVDAHTECSSIWQERGGGVGPILELNL
jgi:predicted phage terminase large subunit-like protein